MTGGGGWARDLGQASLGPSSEALPRGLGAVMSRGDDQDDAFCLVAAAMANCLHSTVNRQDHDPVEPVLAGHELPGAWRLVAGEYLRAGGYRGAAQPPARGAFGHRDGGVVANPPDLMRTGAGDNKDLACLGHE